MNHACYRWQAARAAAVAMAMLFFVVGILVPGAAAAENSITEYVVSNSASGVTDNVPATFGAIFVRGDVPPQSSVVARDASGNALATQVDVKARHSDGSLRHAVITVIVPHLSAGRDAKISLVRSSPQSRPLTTRSGPPEFEAVVSLTMNDGRRLTASAKSLMATGKAELWLAGPQVTEWWVAGPLVDDQGKADPHLSIRFGIRSYGEGRPLRVEVNVENTWIWTRGPRTEFYDTQITVNGQTVLTQPGMSQLAHTRWRDIFWVNGSADAFVKQDLEYLKRARVIPNYNPRATVSEADLSRYYGVFRSSDHRPLATGLITPYMPTTGGRPDIGPFPRWAVYYLKTMDRRAYEMMLSSGELGGSFTSHYRNEKTGRPSTTEEFPNISVHSNYVGRPGNLEIPDTGGRRFNIAPEASHEPSLAFLPYLVTGDRYFLEELQFWSQWNSWATAPETHGFGKSLVFWDQVRGQAWSLRTLAQAAFITPDDDPMKATLQREMAANLAAYDSAFSSNPAANIFHGMIYKKSQDREYSPWMDDFLTWAAGYVAQLGFEDARPFAKWKAYYPVQRMINPDYCWILASSYRMIYENPDLSPVQSWAEAYRLTLAFSEQQQVVDPSEQPCGGGAMGAALHQPSGKMFSSGNPGGYAANLQPALAVAVDFDVPGAKAAWDKFEAAENPIDLQWDILPWGAS